MSDDLVIPAEMVAAQLQAEEALAAVGAWTDSAPDTMADRWAAAYAATARAHELRAPLVSEHGSWTFTAALGKAVQEARPARG
ncbi:hypothetical protein [Streptomyces sp. NPDC048442]|uniref:hypothetical protein n=1 Tax=Streptomyces sp. NPDC048442 TaxID=3154823 RepID=UPI0034364ACF